VVQAPISGRVAIRALGSTASLPFVLTGTRATVGRVDVRWESELVPWSGPIPSDAVIRGGAFDRNGAQASLRNVVNSAQRLCGRPEGPFGTDHLTVTFAPDGSVRNAVLDGSALRGSLIAGCILGRVRATRVPPFAGADVSVGTSVHVDP
jgi:hypothetical protein